MGDDLGITLFKALINNPENRDKIYNIQRKFFNILYGGKN